jgi:hypothetical protein
MSCLIGIMTINDTALKLNEICINDIIMENSLFDGMDRLTLLKMPIVEKATTISLVTGLGGPNMIITDDGEEIPSFIPSATYTIQVEKRRPVSYHKITDDCMMPTTRDGKPVTVL